MGDYEKGLVSVIIPTYKRAELLVKSIHAVLNQTYRDLELLVVNDNIKGDEYSQELYRIIQGIDDERLKLVEQDEHINGAAARNAGIKMARGEYIAFQDDDDYWELTKLERQVKLLSSLSEDYGAVSCLMRYYKNGELVQCRLPYRSGNILIPVLQRRIDLGTGAVLIRHTALDESGYFDQALNRHQDLQLFACLTAKYKVMLDKVYLQNIEMCDGQNRPTAQKLVQVKEAYFHSIRQILQALPKAQQKRIYIMHAFEQAYAFIRAGEHTEGIKRALGIFRSPVTVYLAAERSVNRLIEKKFRNMLSRKYGAQ